MRSALILGLILLPAGIADAHIHLLQPLSRTDNQLGDPQKVRHCGDPGTTRIESRVTTYKPGQTITIMWAETISHPGWFRVAFQPNGEEFPIPKASNGPAGNGADSNYPTENRTGMTDEDTGAIILKDRIDDNATSVEVTLPNIECSNCTLQLIQVMTDKPPYQADTALDGDANDIYYQCADIKLAADAPDPDDMPGMPDAGTDNGGNSGVGGEIGGGCSTGNATGLLAILGLAGLRRRRR